MADLRVPDCRIFVDADLSQTELASFVAQLIFANGDAVGCEADIICNDDYDANRRRQFPGGFLYFRYYIDLYVDDDARMDRAAVVALVLEALWNWGYPAVAACGYEERLPHAGGYRSRSVPWPG